MEESDLSRTLADSESFGPFDSNISTEELDSAVNSISLEGGKITSPLPEKADYASLIPSDAAIFESPLSVPIAKFKLEDNPFSPETYPADADMYPPLPSPQGSVPPSVTTSVSHGQILINGVYYQPVLAPHNLVVAQSAIPQLSIVQIAPAEAPALSTPTSIAPTESTSDSIVLIEPAEAPESSTEGATCSTLPVAGTQTGLVATSFPPHEFGA